MVDEVDLFVVGAGSGGVRAARIAAGYGARVMLAEEFRVGGTCVIRGCVPKKLLVYASRFPEHFHDAAGFGWTVPPASFDWPSLVRAKDKEITRLEGLYTNTQNAAGVTVVKSRAVLEGPHEIRLLADDRRIRAKHILIATGGRPNVPHDLSGVEHAITSNEAFDLATLPSHIVIAGAGYIAIEFAGIFSGLGSKVTVIHRGGEILKNFDEDLRINLQAAYERRGIRFIFNDVFTAIEKTETGLIGHTRQGERLVCDQIMFAIGRSPNVEGLGLDAAGVAVGRRGEIVVDAASRTNVPHIYAVGDVTDRVQLTPVAIREGHAFADTVFGNKPWTVDHSSIATAVFSTPEIGTVGMTEAEAVTAHGDVDIYRTMFRSMKTTLAGGDDRVVMKIVVDAASDRVLGVHILGEGAGEMAQLLGIAVKMGARKSDFDATMAVHPTAAEELVTLRTPSVRHRR
jgi:glutathione reductase (NADPH)